LEFPGIIVLHLRLVLAHLAAPMTLEKPALQHNRQSVGYRVQTMVEKSSVAFYFVFFVYYSPNCNFTAERP